MQIKQRRIIERNEVKCDKCLRRAQGMQWRRLLMEHLPGGYPAGVGETSETETVVLANGDWCERCWGKIMDGINRLVTPSAKRREIFEAKYGSIVDEESAPSEGSPPQSPPG